MRNDVATKPQLQVGENSSSQRRPHARALSRQRVTPPPVGRRALASISYEVGRRYRVPTVRGYIFRKLRDWPVIGPLHEDADIIGYAPLHYHIDWRFVPDRDLPPARWSLYAIVMNESPLNRSLEEQRPVVRLRLCRRTWAPYPRDKATWLPQLEAKYAGCALKGAVCPHRGLPLDSCPADENGIVTCPGHGLRWDINTGKLAR